MEKLSKNWFAEDLIDFEYKKYILLAYLQQVQGNFQYYRLYPSLADLVDHYRNLVQFQQSADQFKSDAPNELKGIDYHQLQLVYENTLKNDELMEEIESIVRFSIPRIRYTLDEGKDIYDDVEQQMNISPIGIVPLYKNEGYLLLKSNEVNETHVYEYKVTLWEDANEKYRGIHTNFVDTYRNSLVNTFEAMKKRLVTENRKLPNPATYLIESEKNYPLAETMLPIASRLLVRYIYTGD